jgi:hypothetical protein
VETSFISPLYLKLNAYQLVTGKSIKKPNIRTRFCKNKEEIRIDIKKTNVEISFPMGHTYSSNMFLDTLER